MLWKDDATKIAAFGEPMGVVAALIPVTNPTDHHLQSALGGKGGQCDRLCPASTRVRSGIETTKILANVAEQMGAPKDWSNALTRSQSKGRPNRCAIAGPLL